MSPCYYLRRNNNGFDYYTHYGELLEEKVEEYLDNLIFKHENYGTIKNILKLDKQEADNKNEYLMVAFFTEVEKELEFRLDKVKLI
ncbi:hypothetical protein CoNPh5_CDS0022 [Staphylococcus phage S-CoN_Ph5]|nr:hypothetical protein CoNPh5_CDS0022 [Staphylococcus phage S-CoN_Ph5]